jgi:hypothetical protein
MVWSWKNKLIETEGEIAKSEKPPKFSAPDVSEHKRMHIAYCNAHDKNSKLCQILLAKGNDKSKSEL